MQTLPMSRHNSVNDAASFTPLCRLSHCLHFAFCILNPAFSPSDYGILDDVYATIAIMSSSVRFCTTGFIIADHAPWRAPSLKSYS